MDTGFQAKAHQSARKVRLPQLGWNEIEVVEEDLGRSAAGMVTRSGFERMVADICMGKVGAVAAREVSRSAAQQAMSAGQHSAATAVIRP
jgi:DNA invertase Pin-like site-specific DNA recombinase